MDILKSGFEFVDKKLLNLPRWLFWFLLFSVTWFYLVRRVISWDLWWHMAAGRYLCENNLQYPPLDTFTYSPTSGTKALSHVWLGDIVLYQVYNIGGFLGLQLLRCTMVLSAVWAVIKVSKYKYNVWTLLGSILLIVGTMQKHLIKNAIFAMFFLSIITWGWVQIKHYNRRYFIWIFGLVLMVWNHMHGTAKIGIAFLGLIFIGECIDQLIRFIRNKKTDLPLLGCFLLVLVSTYPSIDARWSVDIPHLVKSSLTHILGSDTSSSSSSSSQSSVKQKTSEKKALTEADVKAKLKKILRFLFTGHDAKMVAEYQWPFEITYVLSIKFLFFLVVFYTSYLILKLTMNASEFKFSMELPCVLMLVVSLGYLRTVSYSFLAIIPFVAYGMSHGLTFINREKRIKAFCWLGGTVVLFCLCWLGSDALQFFIKMLDKGMINTAGIAVGGDSSITAAEKSFLLKMGNVRALAIPFYFVLPVMTILFLISNDRIYRSAIKVLRTTLGVWVLICVCSYMYYENKLYKEDQFHVVTGFLDTEQGFGKSNKFFNGMADYVIDNYAGEEVYNTYNMGGFLLWRWYGKRRVFIDGRSAVYDNKFYTDYIQNNAATYINKIPLTKGIMNLLVDRDRVLFFLKNGWYPVAFDACMVVLHRPTKLDSSFGVIPKFFEGERPIYGDSRILGNSLEHLDRKALGVFLNQATYHMLLSGRVKDTRIFLDNIQKINNQMPLAVQNVLNERKRFVGQLISHFGEKNHLQKNI